MISDSRPVCWLPIRWFAAGVVALISLIRVSAVRAEVILSGDPPYPMNAFVFTVDPKERTRTNAASRQRGLSAKRFKIPLPSMSIRSWQVLTLMREP